MARIRKGKNPRPVALRKLAAKKSGQGRDSGATNGKPHALQGVIEFPKRPAVRRQTPRIRKKKSRNWRGEGSVRMIRRISLMGEEWCWRCGWIIQAGVAKLVIQERYYEDPPPSPGRVCRHHPFGSKSAGTWGGGRQGHRQCLGDHGFPQRRNRCGEPRDLGCRYGPWTGQRRHHRTGCG
jgi:hypothetical protein